MKRTHEHNRKISEGLKQAWAKIPSKKPVCPTCNKVLMYGAKTCKKHKVVSEETRAKLSLINLGKKQSPELLKKLSLIRKGKPAWNRGIEDFRIRGDKNPAWKGGITSQNRIARNSLKYEMWRKAVFRRDFYTCMLCAEVGGKLHAHHIKYFSLFPELRFVVGNGLTLCVGCHRWLHKEYGHVDYKPQELFIRSTIDMTANNFW